MFFPRSTDFLIEGTPTKRKGKAQHNVILPTSTSMWPKGERDLHPHPFVISVWKRQQVIRCSSASVLSRSCFALNRSGRKPQWCFCNSASDQWVVLTVELLHFLECKTMCCNKRHDFRGSGGREALISCTAFYVTPELLLSLSTQRSFLPKDHNH